MIIAEEYGGRGFSALAHSQVIVKVASRSITCAVTIMVPNSLGPGELLQQYGTQQQKDDHLHRLAAGKEIPCFALTGSEAGSDASSIPDEGVVCRQRFKGKKNILGIRLILGKTLYHTRPCGNIISSCFPTV
jgi:acyl-CoA dehydrogenase